jgi:hypothetical protein
MNLSEVKLKQEVSSVAQAAFGFAIAALVITGIGGTIYKIISPDGWISQAFGKSLSAGAATLGSLMLIVGLAWFSRSSPRYRSTLSDMVVYGFAVAGLLYLVRLWAKGTL